MLSHTSKGTSYMTFDNDMYRDVLNKQYQKRQNRVRFEEYQVQGEFHQMKEVTLDKKISTESSMADSHPDDFYDGKDQSEWNLETYRRKFNDVVGQLHESYTLYRDMIKNYEIVSKEKAEILEKCYQQESDIQVLQRREDKFQKETKEWRLKCRTAEMDYILAQKDIEDIRDVNAFMVEELRLNEGEIASLQKQLEPVATSETDEGRAASSRSRNRFEKEQAATPSENRNRREKEKAATSSGSRNRLAKEQAATYNENCKRIEKEQAATSSGSRSTREKEQVVTSSGDRNRLEKEQAASSGCRNRLEKEQAATSSRRRKRHEKEEAASSGCRNRHEKEQAATPSGSHNRLEKEQTATSSGSRNRFEKEQAASSGCRNSLEKEQAATSSGSSYTFEKEQAATSSGRQSTRVRITMTTEPEIGQKDTTGNYAGTDYIYARRMQNAGKHKAKSLSPSELSRRKASGKWAAFDIVIEGGNQNMQNVVMSKFVRKHNSAEQPETFSKRPSIKVSNVQSSEPASSPIYMSGRGVTSGSPNARLGLKKGNDDMRKDVRIIKQVAKQKEYSMTSCNDFQKNTSGKWAAFDIKLEGGNQKLENLVVHKNAGNLENSTHPAASKKRTSRRATNISPSELLHTRKETSDKRVSSKDMPRGVKVNQKGAKSVENGEQAATSSGSSGTREVNATVSSRRQCTDKYTTFEIPNGSQGSTEYDVRQRTQGHIGGKAEPSVTASREPIKRANNITPPEADKRKSTCNQSRRTGSITPSESASRTRFPPITECTSLIAKFNAAASTASPTDDNFNDSNTGSAMRASTERKKKKDGGFAWYHKIGKSIRSLATVISSSASKLPKINERSSSSLGKCRSSGTFSPGKIAGTKRFRNPKVAPLNIDESANATYGIIYDGTFES